MDFETLIRDEEPRLTARLAFALGGDRHAAEDVRQEAFTRAWRSLPRDLDPAAQRAWLRRTADNLAIDELRRRMRRPVVALDDAPALAAPDGAGEPDAAREALAGLTAHERFVLLLRFEAGFSHAETAQLLDISEDAARKRVARARRAFLGAYRSARTEAAPLVLLISRNEDAAPYVGWLERAGARVRTLAAGASERELALADGLVLSGSQRDIHSGLYGERPRALRGEASLEQDRADLQALQHALALDVPIVGVCRGHQLLNIATGGSLYQDVVLDGVTGAAHDDSRHRVETRPGAAARRLIGRSVEVESTHHQAVRRLGRAVAVTARSPDGVIEMIERSDRRFAIGVQWHPELQAENGDRLAAAFVDAAAA